MFRGVETTIKPQACGTPLYTFELQLFIACMFELSILCIKFFAGSLNVRLRTRKALGWPNICKLTHACLREYRYKRLKLAQLLGQVGRRAHLRPRQNISDIFELSVLRIKCFAGALDMRLCPCKLLGQHPAARAVDRRAIPPALRLGAVPGTRSVKGSGGSKRW
jgi:hypothetical protein